MIAHINIGSNLGNRTANLGSAVALLSRLGQVETVSEPIFTPAWGYDSPNEFINIGVNLLTDLPAPILMQELLKLEREIDPEGRHRDNKGNYADRLIDLDLIDYGGQVIESDLLTLPHPRMHRREFVLRPMAQLLPNWRHPVLNLTINELLAAL